MFRRIRIVPEFYDVKFQKLLNYFSDASEFSNCSENIQKKPSEFIEKIFCSSLCWRSLFSPPSESDPTVPVGYSGGHLGAWSRVEATSNNAINRLGYARARPT
jgi:hypothetical protein